MPMTEQEERLRQERSQTFIKHLGRKGDLVIELHACDFGDGRGIQNALQIYGPRQSGEPVTIPESEAWKYNEPRVLAQQGTLICQLLYGLLFQSGAYRVIDAMVDFIPDLIEAPPPPQLLNRPSGLDRIRQALDEAGLRMTFDDGQKHREVH